MSERRDEPSTEELHSVQRKRETAERDALDDSRTSDEAAQHARRADKAAYLREKLEERARSEREAEEKERRPQGGE